MSDSPRRIRGRPIEEVPEAKDIGRDLCDVKMSLFFVVSTVVAIDIAFINAADTAVSLTIIFIVATFPMVSCLGSN